MILIIDNYDSFVYNLARYVSELGYESMVARNDKITIDEISNLHPSHIIISPGPCTPNEAGVSLQTIDKFHKHIPILGVCLGHQAIGASFGAKVVRTTPVHGKASTIKIHNKNGVFANIPTNFQVGRYHSLSLGANSIPDCLEVTANSEDGQIMAIGHKKYPTIGVQFHPESILTEYGHEMINNFLKISKI